MFKILSMKYRYFQQALFALSILVLSTLSLRSQTTTFNYICPLPESEYINPEQTIILKTGNKFDESCKYLGGISIVGSKSGSIANDIYLSKDKKTIVITPKTPFLIDETITVTTGNGFKNQSGIPVASETFMFKTVTTDTKKLRKSFAEYMDHEENDIVIHPEIKRDNIMNRDNNLPADYPPPYTEIYNEVGDDYYFATLNPRAGGSDYNPFLTIFDKYGTPVFFRRTSNQYLNLHVMNDGRLAAARNIYTNPSMEKYFFMDSSYVVTDSIKTGNGYDMDGHDILLTANGNYMLLSYDPQIVNMSLIVPGGNTAATVTGLVIQEVTPEGVVLFQWRSWDHFEITDATSDISLTASNIDYVHGNAIEFDQDSNLLISSRNMDEVTKIDMETGDVIYRLGLLAENNEFTITGDSWGFSHQHDVRVLPNGNITVFDNGNLHAIQFSRALEYVVDENNMTAQEVWDYRHNPDVYAAYTGSFRTYDDDTKLIGWGASIDCGATLLSDNGVDMEIFYSNNAVSYRTLKYPWQTNMFIAPESIDFGNYAGNNEPKYRTIPVTNTSENTIRISSVYNITDMFYVESSLPVQITPEATVDITFAFMPPETGTYNDVLTLNYDKFILGAGVERVAQQVKVCGMWNSDIPTVDFIPEFGSENIDRDIEISVVFSEPMRKIFGQPIEDNDIPNIFDLRLNDMLGDEVPIHGNISDDNMIITIIPDAILNSEQQYYCELKSGTIKGINGGLITQKETTIFTTSTSVEISEQGTKQNINVFPSPFNDYLKITTDSNSTLQLYNANGQNVREQQITAGITTICTSNLTSGAYMVVIVNNNGSRKLTKVVKVVNGE